MTSTLKYTIYTTLFIFGCFFASASFAAAATLSLTPGTGVYSSGATFTARVVVNSAGQSINAAEGTLKFNPSELSVIGINRSSSIFNLWVAEPSYSNSAGTISFSGGLPSGYSGSSGTILTVTFRANGSGPAKVNFTNGSVLANDGRGSNVLTGMSGGTYTIQASAPQPEPEEVVIEYVAPANTPPAPVIESDTHPDPSKWYAGNVARLSWSLPSGVTAVRTLLDNRATGVPTKVYDTPISELTINDLDEGVSYLHVQFQNADGWGRVTNYRLAVDTTKPESIEISQPDAADATSPQQELKVDVIDATSEVNRFLVKIDNDDPIELTRENSSSTLVLPMLGPGYHTIVIEAFDEAGNSIVGTYSLTIASFEPPVFTDFPIQLNEGVIPVIKGTTRPEATVIITVTKAGAESTDYEVSADQEGVFTFIPDSSFSSGVYEIQARAVDKHGAQSEVSASRKLAVQQPGYIRIGSVIISFLSILIPLIALTGLMILTAWYMFSYLRRFRKRVRVESVEAMEILHREFASLQSELRNQEDSLRNSRKTKKLTKAEAAMIETIDKALQTSQRKVEKEIEDVTELTDTNN